MRRKIALGTAAIAVLIVAITGVSAGPAAAHESLISSSPSEGERLAAPPDAVELVFTDEVLPVGAVVVVVDESGRNWAADDVAIDGSTVRVAIPEVLPDAGYQVRWRVVSGDGHPISSTIPFAVGDAEPLTGNIASDLTSTPAPDETATSATEATRGGPSVPWMPLVIGLGGAAAAVLLYLAISAAVRRARANP